MQLNFLQFEQSGIIALLLAKNTLISKSQQIFITCLGMCIRLHVLCVFIDTKKTWLQSLSKETQISVCITLGILTIHASSSAMTVFIGLDIQYKQPTGLLVNFKNYGKIEANSEIKLCSIFNQLHPQKYLKFHIEFDRHVHRTYEIIVQ